MSRILTSLAVTVLLAVHTSFAGEAEEGDEPAAVKPVPRVLQVTPAPPAVKKAQARVFIARPAAPRAAAVRAAERAPASRRSGKPLAWEREVYAVRHVPVLELAKAIEELLEGEREASESAGAALPPDQHVVIVAEPIGNRLIISAAPEVFDDVMEIVEQLDEEPPMVSIQVMLVELTPENDGGATPVDVAMEVTGKKIEAVMLMLEKRGEVRVLARPQILTLSNQPAFVQTGRRVPRVTGTRSTGGQSTRQVEMENVGLILGVTPRVNPDGLVTMEIDVEKSKLGPEAEGVPLSVAPDGETVRSPQIECFTVQTTISAKTGQTVVLGGLSTKAEAGSSELLILLTPSLVPPRG